MIKVKEILHHQPLKNQVLLALPANLKKSLKVKRLLLEVRKRQQHKQNRKILILIQQDLYHLLFRKRLLLNKNLQEQSLVAGLRKICRTLKLNLRNLVVIG